MSQAYLHDKLIKLCFTAALFDCRSKCEHVTFDYSDVGEEECLKISPRIVKLI